MNYIIIDSSGIQILGGNNYKKIDHCSPIKLARAKEIVNVSNYVCSKDSDMLESDIRLLHPLTNLASYFQRSLHDA
jgi:hypothetical protein